MSKITGQPSKKLLALLEQRERKAVRGDVPEGLLSKAMTAGEFTRDFEDAVITDNIGVLLKTAREQTQESARGAAERIGVSHPRVLAVERGGSRIECSTLVRFAEALGYEVSVSLRPKSGKGQPIVANLSPDEFESVA